MKYNLAYSLILIFVCFSCGREPNDCCTIIDVDVNIHYQTSSGENLLNSSEDYDVDDIKIYYKNGNEYEYVFDGNLDYPNMHYVDADENGNLILTVFLSNYYEGNQSTTLIKINEVVTDTIVGDFDLSGNNQVCTAAKLNGLEMDNRRITVVK